MKELNVTLFASANRPKLWESFIKSISGTTVSCNIVFCGNSKVEDVYPFHKMAIENGIEDFKYIYTENIKPAQCYEIARRYSYGETLIWVADDCEFPNDIIGKAYRHWKNSHNEKLILSLQTRESGYNIPDGQLFDMKQHCFFGYDPNSPLMAPIALISRKFLNDLKGLDRRYVCGQYENDIVQRAYTFGGSVEIFGDSDCFVDIDHLRKSIEIGESKNAKDFLNRPFATGFEEDRKILENSWSRFNQEKAIKTCRSGKKPVYKTDMFDISETQLDTFEPYSESISFLRSESNKGKWE